MSFATYGYIFLFLPLTVCLFWLAQRKSLTVALWLLSFASLVFYAQWNPRDLVIIGVSISFNYHAAKYILRHTSREKLFLAFSIAGNLCVLGYFKYLGFFAQLLGIGSAIDGFQLSEIVLPLGISFFTFTQIAYLVDCSQSKISAQEHRPRDYILFVLFFPHLIAGPILHHASVIPQFHGAFKVNRAGKIQAGVIMFAIGLFKKVMIADYFGTIATPVFNAAAAGHALSAGNAWIGAFSYTLQIYFDFSGYSDMAVGSALLVGMHIPFNFFSPYKSTNVIEFWRRWHISLSAYLRDYLYIPLGGNRHGPVRRYVNIFITMLLGGIWHGAGMNFVIWGALHGFYITINHAWRDFVKPKSKIHFGPNVASIAGYLLTMFAVVIAWVFFRASSFSAATTMLNSMLGLLHSEWSATNDVVASSTIYALAMGFLFTLVFPNSRQIHDWMLITRDRLAWSQLGLASGVAVALSLVFITADSPFLYFQF